MEAAITATAVAGFPVARGKVRDVYDLGDALALVATDRVSAFDHVLPDGIPGKGVVLTAMSVFWLKLLGEPNHFLSDDLADLPAAFREHVPSLAGRALLVKKARVIPVECVARGYLAGSGWQEYREHGTLAGLPLPGGLREADALPTPRFTPATKAEAGEHDENIMVAELVRRVGPEVAAELERRTLRIYAAAAEHARKRGVILADTKFEFGMVSFGGPRGRQEGDSGEIILIDEALTPDSSRFWPAAGYRPGGSPPSFDKQFLRDWLLGTGWDRQSPPPRLPAEVVAQTAGRYREALARLTGPVGV